MNKKLNFIIELMQNFSRIDEFLHQYINGRIYDNLIGPLSLKIEDACYLILFNKDYDTIFKSFATPGMPDNEKHGRIILWDHVNGGFPPEKLSDLLLNSHKYKKEDLIKRCKKQIKLIRKGLKEQEQMNKNIKK